MAQSVRSSEQTGSGSAAAGSAKRERKPARAEVAFARIADAADRSPESGRYVAILLEAVADAAEQSAASGAMSDAERALWEDVGAEFDDTDAAARVRGRGVVAFALLLARSEAGDKAVADRLNVDRSRISQRVAEPSLYAVAYGEERYYPTWQFDKDGLLRGLKPVLGALDPTLHPLVVDHWFTAPNRELTVAEEALSPVGWLRTGGDIDVLVELARDL